MNSIWYIVRIAARQWQKICVIVSLPSTKPAFILIREYDSVYVLSESAMICGNRNNYHFWHFCGQGQAIHWFWHNSLKCLSSHVHWFGTYLVRTIVPILEFNFWFAQNWIYCLAIGRCCTNGGFGSFWLEIAEQQLLTYLQEWIECSTPRLGIHYWPFPMCFEYFYRCHRKFILMCVCS